MNPFDLLKDAQALQSKMQEAQAKLASIRAVGNAGAGMVTVELNGEFRVLSVTIDPEILNPSDAAMVQDLVLAAHNDALAKIRERIREELAGLAGGLPLPPGLFG